MVDVVIVGAGPAGLACALACRRLGLSVQVLEAAREAGGQLLHTTRTIMDYPGVEATGPELRDRLLAMARASGASILLGTPVLAVQAAARTVTIGSSQPEGVGACSAPMAARYLVLAMGGTPRRLGVPGEEEMHRLGETYRGSRDAATLAGRDVAVVGGGDRAVENALMLHRHGVRVTLLHRGSGLRARPQLQAQLRGCGIACIDQAEVRRITVAERVEALEFERVGRLARLRVSAVLIYIGLRPHSDLVRGQLELEDDGRIRTDAGGATSQAGVYAVGDVCVPSALSSIATCAGQAVVVAKRIALQG